MGDGEIIFLSYGDICFGGSSAALTFGHMTSSWLAYGIYVFLIVAVSHSLGWSATISVNAVIGTHFLMTRDFSPEFIRNELFLVMIGITIAIVLNLFYDYEGQRQDLIRYMRETEDQLQILLCELAAYLHNKDMEINVRDRIIAFEGRMHEFIKAAYDYQDNTFHSHPGYYIDYFEMRRRSCRYFITCIMRSRRSVRCRSRHL